MTRKTGVFMKAIDDYTIRFEVTDPCIISRVIKSGKDSVCVSSMFDYDRNGKVTSTHTLIFFDGRLYIWS